MKSLLLPITVVAAFEAVVFVLACIARRVVWRPPAAEALAIERSRAPRPRPIRGPKSSRQAP